MAFEFMEVLPVMTMQLAHAGLNLFVATCLGAAIGLERQWRQRLAGLRTNALVALGAAIFVTYGRVASDDGLGLYGLMAAAFVLAANIALRPIVHAINR
jgi:uncharacterized membrane protein YhiD involved in acid resistance